jgi:hypothetical protein
MPIAVDRAVGLPLLPPEAPSKYRELELLLSLREPPARERKAELHPQLPNVTPSSTPSARSFGPASERRARVRVELHLGDRATPAEAVVLGQTGALVFSPEALPVGTLLSISSASSGERARFEVVWNGGPDGTGHHKVGLAMVKHHPGFWSDPSTR